MSEFSTLDNNFNQILSELMEFIAIPSISTDPAYKAECEKAANWCAAKLNAIGFDARTENTGGHSFVLAHSPKIPNARHILFYGHYDIQPVDPISLWNYPPFEGKILEENGQKIIHGRGASDDKGQVMTFIAACQALIEENALPLNITILLEGEEETGSPSLPTFLEKFQDELKADWVFVCDTGMVDADTPAIATQLRGLMEEEITIKAANTDLHSGLYGGAARNPAHVLARILAKFHDDEGKVQIPNFYDGVHETPQAILESWANLEKSQSALLPDVGLSLPAGEKGRSVYELVWARPTLEINGMDSGYTGEGFKTVLPAKAMAKISCRLVGDQDPNTIRENIREFVRKEIPEDCTVEFKYEGGNRAITFDASQEEFQIALNALKGLWNNDAVAIGMGGSIPILSSFQSVLGMECLLIGFALPSDRIHAPNERYQLSSFEKGSKAWYRILKAFG